MLACELPGDNEHLRSKLRRTFSKRRSSMRRKKRVYDITPALDSHHDIPLKDDAIEPETLNIGFQLIQQGVDHDKNKRYQQAINNYRQGVNLLRDYYKHESQGSESSNSWKKLFQKGSNVSTNKKYGVKNTEIESKCDEYMSRIERLETFLEENRRNSIYETSVDDEEHPLNDIESASYQFNAAQFASLFKYVVQTTTSTSSIACDSFDSSSGDHFSSTDKIEGHSVETPKFDDTSSSILLDGTPSPTDLPKDSNRSLLLEEADFHKQRGHLRSALAIYQTVQNHDQGGHFLEKSQEKNCVETSNDNADLVCRRINEIKQELIYTKEKGSEAEIKDASQTLSIRNPCGISSSEEEGNDAPDDQMISHSLYPKVLLSPPLSEGRGKSSHVSLRGSGSGCASSNGDSGVIEASPAPIALLEDVSDWSLGLDEDYCCDSSSELTGANFEQDQDCLLDICYVSNGNIEKQNIISSDEDHSLSDQVQVLDEYLLRPTNICKEIKDEFNSIESKVDDPVMKKSSTVVRPVFVPQIAAIYSHIAMLDDMAYAPTESKSSSIQFDTYIPPRSVLAREMRRKCRSDRESPSANELARETCFNILSCVDSVGLL